MNFKKIDYKGKYFTIEDVDDDWNYTIGEITKKEALEPEFVKSHKRECLYYGIPPYIGEDKDLLKVYK